MKKVLFTLATLFACMTMFAQGQATPFCGVAPVIVFGDADGNEITEVTVTPGVDVECSFVLKSIDDQVYMVSGFQTQWKMFDANHANIDFATDAKVFCPKIYGGRVKGWLNPVGIGTSDESAGGFDGVSLANEIPYANVYRVMGTNTKYNMVFFHDDADGNPTCPAVFGKFTIRTSADWAEEYATFEFDKAYTLWNQCPGDDPNVFEEATNPDDCVLMIKNANYVPAVTLADPVIAFAEENNVLTVTVSCPTEGATLIVNGEAVANPYSYTVNHEDIYAPQVVTVTAQSVLGDQTSAEVTDSYTFQAQTQPYADEPVITFDEDGSGVMITIENFTEYTIKVDGEIFQQRNEAYAYVEKVYDRAQAIEVYAKNDPGYPFIATEDTKTYNLPAKEKAKNSTPSVTHSYDPNTGELNVWAYGCTEENVTYTLYCDGVEYTGTMPIIVDSEVGYNHTWTATAVSPTTTVSDESAPDAIVIEGITPPTITPDPTIDIVTDLEEGTVTITVEGQGTVTASVTNGAGTTNYTDEDGDGKIVIVIPCGQEEDFIIVNATAQLPGDNVVAGRATSELTTVPAKTEKPVITYEEVEGGVNVTVTGNGTLNVLIDGYGDGDVITYTGNSPYTYFLASTADDQEVTVSANAQEEGKAVSDYAIEDIYIPAATTPVDPDHVGQPTFQGYTVDGVTGYGVYIFPSVPADADIMYRVLVWDPVAEEWVVRNDWSEYTGEEKEIWFENNGEKVRVEAYAYVGNMTSETAAYEFTVETALNELMGGKTVAGVRYFNMAGQEMQEANGMTIVVTTYTDGTTSAVKVMK